MEASVSKVAAVTVGVGVLGRPQDHHSLMVLQLLADQHSDNRLRVLQEHDLFLDSALAHDATPDIFIREIYDHGLLLVEL